MLQKIKLTSVYKVDHVQKKCHKVLFPMEVILCESLWKKSCFCWALYFEQSMMQNCSKNKNMKLEISRTLYSQLKYLKSDFILVLWPPCFRKAACERLKCTVHGSVVVLAAHFWLQLISGFSEAVSKLWNEILLLHSWHEEYVKILRTDWLLSWW